MQLELHQMEYTYAKKYDLVLKNDFYIMSDGWGSHIKNRRDRKSHKTHSN